jgi:molybdenum cofactor guanylyltransferase
LTVTHVEAAILAGGRSSRMGRDKAGVELDGVPLVARVARAIAQCIARVRIVLHDADASPPLDLPVIRDIHKERAPLVGIAAALACAEAPWVLIAACDMPDLQPALLLALCALAPVESPYSIIVPEGPRGPEPLLALYRPRLLPLLEERIVAGDLALQPLLATEHALRIPADDLRSADPTLASLHNVNRPEDLDRGLGR